jgi:ribosomal protein S18 acetylase RimI-like enzyme
MMGWFPDADSARLWGGPAVAYPFSEESFFRDAKFAKLPSRVLLTASGELAGFGQYYLRAGRCHLGRLVIAPGFRRQGFGIQLIEQLMEEGRAALDVRECSLFVDTRNAAAIALYERLGFGRATYPDNDVDASGWHYMVKA